MPQLPKLPNLIFTENHLDSKTSRILAKVGLRLKQLGYQCFLDEMPLDTTIDNHTQLVEEGEDLFKQVAIKLKKEKGIDISDPKSLAHPFFLTTKGPGLASFIKRHQARIHFDPFLKSLKTNRMDYVAIDCGGEDAERERFMAQAFLKEKSPFFARIGRAHAQNIQEMLLDKHPHTAADKFCFFDIFSDESSMTKLKDLPLGIVSINATRLSDDQVVDKIVKRIVAKQTQAITRENALVQETAKQIMQAGQAKVEQNDFVKNAIEQVQGSYLTSLSTLTTTLAGAYLSTLTSTISSVINYFGFFSSKKSPEPIVVQPKPRNIITY